MSIEYTSETRKGGHYWHCPYNNQFLMLHLPQKCCKLIALATPSTASHPHQTAHLSTNNPPAASSETQSHLFSVMILTSHDRNFLIRNLVN